MSTFAGTEKNATTEVHELTALDRCDVGNCGAAAYIRTGFRNGFFLDFCGHHYREHEAGLAKAAASELVDNRAMLNEKPGIGI